MLENRWNDFKSMCIFQLIFEALAAQDAAVLFQLSVLAGEVQTSWYYFNFHIFEKDILLAFELPALWLQAVTSKAGRKKTL